MRRQLPLTGCLLAAVVLFLSAPAVQAQSPYVLQRLTGPITLDGLSNEAAWQAVEPLPMLQQAPDYGAPPTDQTVVRIAYDDDFLYVGGEMYDDPAEIQGPTLKRDQLSPNNDYLGIILDTFNDKENGLCFFTTPAGIRLDMTIFNDAQGDLNKGEIPWNTSWDTFWDVEVVRNEQGWFVEMRIPFSSLRFQEQDGQVTMGLLCWRWTAGNGEVAIFPVFEAAWGGMSPFKPSQGQEVVLEGIRSRRPLYITPYLLGGEGFSYALNDPETAYDRLDDPTREVGLDLKYGITSNLTFDVTVNTDFAQVEADDQQVNLTRFSLFFPEKRRFFMERSSAFNVGLGGQNRLFYSRRIGLYEGRQIPILGGARLVGRVGGWDVALLDMQTDEDRELPSENFGVLRLRRQVFNPNSYLGSIVTSRYGRDGSYNLVYGLDGIFRVAGDDYFTFVWAQSFEDDETEEIAALDRARIRAFWERRKQDGFFYNLGYGRGGEVFDPEMGFDLREDFTEVSSRIGYGWVAAADTPLNRYQLLVDGFTFWRNADKHVESAEFGVAYNAFFNNYASLNIAVKTYYEDLDEEFELSEKKQIEIPIGMYDFYGVEVLYGAGGTLLATDFYLRMGTFYDGNRFTAGLGPRWAISRIFNISGLYELNRLSFPPREEAITTQLGRIRLQATFTTAFSATAFVQYSESADAGIANLRFRYNPREGVDLYLVYNEGIYTDRLLYDPVRPYRSDRIVMLKYAYTFLFQ